MIQPLTQLAPLRKLQVKKSYMEVWEEASSVASYLEYKIICKLKTDSYRYQWMNVITALIVLCVCS